MGTPRREIAVMSKAPEFLRIAIKAIQNIKIVDLSMLGAMGSTIWHMKSWDAVRNVGSILSLIAFGVLAVLKAYLARLKHSAEIIKSAPEKVRLEAIAAVAKFFPVDVPALPPAHQ